MLQHQEVTQGVQCLQLTLYLPLQWCFKKKTSSANIETYTSSWVVTHKKPFVFSPFFPPSNSRTSKLQPGSREEGVIPSQSFETVHKASVNNEKWDEGGLFSLRWLQTLSFTDLSFCPDQHRLSMSPAGDARQWLPFTHTWKRRVGRPETCHCHCRSIMCGTPAWEMALWSAPKGGGNHLPGAQAITHRCLDIFPTIPAACTPGTQKKSAAPHEVNTKYLS